VETSKRFGRLLIEHIPALRRYALGLSRDRAAADDLVQDCLEHALRRMDALRSEERIASWLRSILFNLFITGHRTSSRRGKTLDAEVLDHMADATPQPDLRQEVNEILRAMSELTPLYRQVLVLVAVEGLSYRETAEELGVPVGTVMSRLARARDQLRETLATQPEHGLPPAQRGTAR